MTSASSFAVLALLAFAFACAQLPPSERVLVKLRPGASVDALDAVLSRYGARRVGVISAIAVRVVEPASASNARELADALKREPFVEFAEVDELVPPSTRRSSPTAPP